MILNYLQKLNYILHFFICQVYPSQCCVCYADCLTANLLCSNCWFKVNFLTAPTCQKCGSTVDSLYNNVLCQGDSCFYKAHHYNSITSIIAYNDIGKELIGKFKFQKKFILMKLWQCWFACINQQLKLLQADLIIPVPMHKEKLKIRGFNQTAFLARILAKVSKIYYGRNILCKVKDTPNQRDL